MTLKSQLPRHSLGLVVSAFLIASPVLGQPGAATAQRPAATTPAPTTQRPAAGQAPAQPPAAGARATNQVAGPKAAGVTTLKEVARINNLSLKREELERECITRHGEEVLETMINKSLIMQACANSKIVVSPQEVAEEINRISKRFGLDHQQWVKMLEEERNVTEDQYTRDIIWPSLALRKLAGTQVQITAEEIQLAFEQEYGEARQVRMIMVEDEKTAREVHAKAIADPNQFPRLAIEHSKDYNTASAGGLMQPVRKHTGFEEVEVRAFTMAEGAVSDVFSIGKAQKHWLVIKVDQHIPGRPIPAENRPEVEKVIAEALREKKMMTLGKEMFVEMRKKAAVASYTDPAFRQAHPDLAATVNNQPIRMADLATECAERHGKTVLESMISRILLEQETARLQIKITEDDINQELGLTAREMGLIDRNGLPDVNSLITKIVAEQKMTPEFYTREIVWPTVALKKLSAAKVQVSDEDLHFGYEANYGERVEVLAIVSDNQRRAQEVWEKARRAPPENMKETFAKLAETYSSDPASRALSGAVPPIHRHCGEPLLEREAFRLQPGELSSLIQVDQHFVILLCLGRIKPVAANFEQVRDLIHEDVFRKKQRLAMQDVYKEIEEKATIDNFVAKTTKHPERAKGGPNGAIGPNGAGPAPEAPREANVRPATVPTPRR